MTPAEKLAARSLPMPNGCIEWRGAIFRSGYGAVRVDGQAVGAHRVSLMLSSGPPPEGKNMALHRCHNRKCVNPEHLYWGDAADNGRDTAEAGRAFNGNRAKTHCPRGHEYDLENTYVHRGLRSCKECRRQKVRERRARLRAAVA